MSQNKILEDKYFKIKIKNDPWNIYLVPESDDTIVDEDSRAETVFKDKEIYFKETDIYTVRHELVHAYNHYCYVDAAQLSQLQTEEVLCEMLAYEWDNITKTIDEVYKGLQKLKEDK